MNFKSNGMPIWVCLLMLIASVVYYPARLDAGIVHQQDFTASDFDIWSMTAPNGDSFSKVSGQDMFGSGEVGQPELPYKVIRFLVPDNAYDFNVTIEDMGATSPFVLKNAVYPVQKDIPINDYRDDMFTFPDKEIYRSLKTSFRSEILEESRLEGRYHIVAVGLWPLAYSGNEKELEMCTSMLINLDYRENTVFKQKNSKENTASFINISDIVVNDATVPKASISTPKKVIDGSEPSLPRYYIISERALIPALEDLATWKTQKGYYVVTKAIEDIYADSKYKVGTNGIVDEAASLRKYLQDEFALHGTFFCFLIGDHRTKIPIRKAYWNNTDADNDDVNGDKYIPTDNYFSDLSEDGWPVQYDDAGIYVAKTSSSINPNIYVGRLLCNKSQEIENYIKKLILYETNPGRGYRDYLDSTTITVMYDGVGSYWGIKKGMESLFPSVECLLDCKIANKNNKGYPSGQQMLQKLNESGYCSWIGHGEPSTVACSGTGDTSSDWEYIKALSSYQYTEDPNTRQTGIRNSSDNSIDQLTNFDCPSIVNTLACTTCPFDVYASPGWVNFDIPHTIASAYTVGGLYGGVAFLGNTRPGYFGISNALEVLFLQQLEKNHKLGIAEAVSKSLFNTSKSKYWHVRQTHNLIGDPEFELWINQPSNLDANASWNQSEISVGGTDAIGCTAVVNNGSEKVRVHTVDGSERPPVAFIGGGKMEAIGIYKTGFLPTVKLECYDDELEDCNKKFVVREAMIGCTEYSSVLIGQNANIDIRAVDSINVGAGLNILSEGQLSLRCDKQVSLEGAEVATGGKLTIKGEKVTLSNGFSIKDGATLSITTN